MNAVGAEALRRQFDEGFSAAPRTGVESMTNVLTLRIGGDAYAVLLSDLSGLAANEVIVPVPTASAALLGLVGLRGAFSPVFDLGALLGYPAARDPRWLLLVGRAPLIALGFHHFEAHLRLPAEALASGGIVQTADVRRRLIDVTALTKSIRDHRYE